ncbi:MAG: sigma-E factor negative regulatory protein [Pseudomonadales bacterium]|nr:sigma-E factor negative regulatory protein [Halioglobus sp.]MCP5129517.1 sigma-E factor negative regulatory protein [Pseudomonadales bacterium]
MSEAMRESLSALLDDEANELEMQRVLARIADDPELRQVWVRYNMVRTLTGGQTPAHPDLDISAQVREAIGGKSAGVGLRHRLLKPLASVAVAASVAVTVVLGGQQLAQLDADSYNSQAIASSVSPVGMVNSLGATSVQASYGTQGVVELEPATGTAYQELARQRLQKYMQEHAEHAALNSPNGLVPFARVPIIQE